MAERIRRKYHDTDVPNITLCNRIHRPRNQGWAILEDFIGIPILEVRIAGNWSISKPPRILLERIDHNLKSPENNW